jgi:hypothetical protein
MMLASLFGSALLLGVAANPGEARPAPPPGPPERIVLPLIQPDCDRPADAEAITVCGRTDRRFRIDLGTLETIRGIQDRDDPGKRPRPRAITESCSGIGPMDACGGDIPISGMALRAIGLAVKAISGVDLRPALRQGPTDYDIYQRARAASKKN